MPTLRMPNINQVALSGRLVRDPDFRFMDNGAARLRARIAVNRSYRDRNEQWQEETSFFDVVMWNKVAEVLCKRLQKGTPVFITGRLQSHQWENEEGDKFSRVVVQVRNLQVLEKEEAEDVPELADQTEAA